MSSRARLALAAAAFFAAASFAFTARRFWPFTVDDTFITLRYAKHVAEGLGPSFNPGGPRVEGYTTVLWMALLALPHAVGVDALVFAKALGGVCTFGAFALASSLAHALTHEAPSAARTLAAAVPFALLAGYWPLSLHAISGMETALAELSWTAFALASVRHLAHATHARAAQLAVIALLSALNRPEMALAAGAALLVQLAMTRRTERRAFVSAAAFYCVLPGLVYFVARYTYFGLLFPLPFYVKATGQGSFPGYEEVVLFLTPFATSRVYLGALAIAGAVRATYPTIAGVVAFLLFFLVPAHIMGFESRYLVPVVPVLAALMGTGAARLSTFAARFVASERQRVFVAVFAVGCWSTIALLRFPAHEREAEQRWVGYGEGLTRAHVALGLDLSQRKSARRSIALLDVGAVSYYSEWNTLDTYGLNDVTVALAKRGDIDYVFAEQPELFVAVSAESGRYVEVFEWETPLYRRALELGYELERSLEFLPDYHLLVYRRLRRERSPRRRACRRRRAFLPAAPRLHRLHRLHRHRCRHRRQRRRAFRDRLRRRTFHHRRRRVCRARRLHRCARPPHKSWLRRRLRCTRAAPSCRPSSRRLGHSGRPGRDPRRPHPRRDPYLSHHSAPDRRGPRRRTL